MILTLLRYMQLYTHICHNKLSGKTFFQDHEFLGEIYPVYESDYDDVAERLIGLGNMPDFIKIHKKAAEILEEPTSYEEAFKNILDCEKDLCSFCTKEAKGASLGYNNLLSAIADKSEARQYKIKQRLK